MKKKLNFILVLLAIFIASSCSVDNLDIPQKGVISYDNFYKTEKDAESAVASCYSSAQQLVVRGITGGLQFNYSPYLELFNLLSDDMNSAGTDHDDHPWGHALNEYHFSTEHETITCVYRSLYAVIYTANLVITNFGSSDNANIRRCVAEARVWRAWSYFLLATWWGTPPLVTTLLSSESPGNSAPGEVMAFVIKEFEEAAADIPSKTSKTDKAGTVRLTKEAVYAFLGKALVQDKQYAKAADILKTNIIDKNLYDLVSGPEMEVMFHQDGNYSVEKIFEFNVVNNTAITSTNMNNTMAWQSANRMSWRGDRIKGGTPIEVYGSGWGGWMPTKSFAEALIANDGIDSYRRKAWIKTWEEFICDLTWSGTSNADKTRDERMKDPNRGLNKTTVPLHGCDGYFMWKRIPWKKDECPGRNSYFLGNQVIMRYAEVLLLFAEACAQSGKYPAEGLAALNRIQNRAGSAYVSSSLTLNDVKKEKRYELWLEGTRSADLIRWGDAATVLANNGSAIPDWYDVDPNDHYKAAATHTDWKAVYSGGFKSGKHELLPFPFWATSRNPNLKQNPGW